MAIDLNHHYKERDPEETIKIIEDFFKKRNIEIRKLNEAHSNIDTYSCTYGLYWQNQLILSCNGKGTEYLYSKASCFGELYERFCCYSITNNYNIFLKNDVMYLRNLKYGYQLHKDEKEIDKDTYLKNPIIKNSQYFNKLLGIKNNIEDFAYIYSNNKLLGIKYQSLTDDTINYQDLTSIIWNAGTIGLATGNTLEEALVQGSAELFERIVIEKFFYEPQSKYYLIDQTILDQQYQDKIKLLINLGFKVYIYDLSFNFHMPVIFLIIYNPTYKVCYFRFGSHPIFNIALEKCFTELYQGYIELPLQNTNLNLEFYKPESSFKYIKNNNLGITSNLILPYYIFNNNILIKHFNEKYYLNADSYNNKTLLSFIKNIIKLQNYHFDYVNISLSNDIFAIHIVPREFILTCNSRTIIELENFTLEDQNNFCLAWKMIYNIFSYIKTQKEIYYNQDTIAQNINIFFNYITNISNNVKLIINYLSIFTSNEIYNPFYLKEDNRTIDGFENLLYLIINDYDHVEFPVRDCRKIMWEQFKNFNLLSNTQKEQLYNILELDCIDFNNKDNIYLIYLIYVYTFHKIYTSNKYYQFLDILTMDDRKCEIS